MFVGLGIQGFIWNFTGEFLISHDSICCMDGAPLSCLHSRLLFWFLFNLSAMNFIWWEFLGAPNMLFSVR
jgi:hypothetical protein